MDLADWRTVDRETYCFSVNGGPPQTGQHMLEVGTYNALIQSNEFYCPAHSTFEDSHKTFKRMMPTFAWEVLEVYSGPPVAAFRWRHWGTFKENYKGVNGCVDAFFSSSSSSSLLLFFSLTWPGFRLTSCLFMSVC